MSEPYLRGDERWADVVVQRLILDKLRLGVSWTRNLRMDVRRESWDFNNRAAYELTMIVARLPEQGTLTVSHPTTWYDALKRDVLKPTITRHVPTLLGWLGRRLRVRMTTVRYEASAFLPMVPLPDNMLEGSFYVWREGVPVKDYEQ